ncbi:MAG: dTMP kinase [Treponema sp.]|nr:dTMP kinase [Treponema sp.]
MILKNFIVFEGIDGSGTSTQIKRLVESNPELFYPTAEPTKNETGLFLRKILSGDIKVDEKTNAYLFAADRCEHIFGAGGVSDILKTGKKVVSDRYFFSSMAYQSVSCGKELPRLLNSIFPLPEYLFYFQINPEISLARVNARASANNEKKEIYEKIEIQKKIAALYEEVISEYEHMENAKTATEEKMKIIRVDASKSMDEVTAFIKEKLA